MSANRGVLKISWSRLSLVPLRNLGGVCRGAIIAFLLSYFLTLCCTVSVPRWSSCCHPHTAQQIKSDPDSIRQIKSHQCWPTEPHTVTLSLTRSQFFCHCQSCRPNPAVSVQCRVPSVVTAVTSTTSIFGRSESCHCQTDSHSITVFSHKFNLLGRTVTCIVAVIGFIIVYCHCPVGDHCQWPQTSNSSVQCSNWTLCPAVTLSVVFTVIVIQLLSLPHSQANI